MDWTKEQLLVCNKYKTSFCESPSNLKVGIALAEKDIVFPIHGLRHPMEGDTSGWYIWQGDFSSASDFFAPIHVAHLSELRPQVIKYLGLPPGWRFMIAPNYEDVWEDLSLLKV